MSKEVSKESMLLLEKINNSNKELGYKPSMMGYRGIKKMVQHDIRGELFGGLTHTETIFWI